MLTEILMNKLQNIICQTDTEMFADLIKGIRNCHALSKEEDDAIRNLRLEAQRLFETYGADNGAYLITEDAIRNLFITVFGENREETVMSGSHIDSVKDGGIYDGLAGVCSAFEYLEKLLKSGMKPAKNYTVAVFCAEESSPRTGVSCLGSKIATGQITEEELEAIEYTLDDGNRMPLKDYIAKDYGIEMWNGILEEIKNPPIKSGEVVAYEELHIEQSSVLERNGAMAGILIDGIGGAVREKAQVVLPDFFEEREIGRGWSYRFDIHGRSDHTGGTPPNSVLKEKFVAENDIWYRTDALVAGAYLSRMLLRFAKNHEGVYFTGFSGGETGYTTVPFLHNIGITVEEGICGEFESYLENCVNLVERNFGVNIEGGGNFVEHGNIKYMNTEVADKLMQIPLAAERYSRNAVSMQGGLGKVRLTITDFGFREVEDGGGEDNRTNVGDELAGESEGISGYRVAREKGAGRLDFKVDYRDVDSYAVSELIELFHNKFASVMEEILMKCKSEGGKFVKSLPKSQLETVSTKRFSAVTGGGPVVIKQSYANYQGIKILEMPSLPGHDAGVLADAGIPVSMTFVAHDGKSHSPDEYAPEENMEKAMQISHDFLSVKLGVNL